MPDIEIIRDAGDPPEQRKRGPDPEYPFDKMKAGDAFVVECEPEKVRSIRASVLTSARRRGYSVTTRRVPEGIKVWFQGEREQ